MGERFQIHLSGKGYSGRALRYVVLSSDKVDHNEKLAAQSASKDAKPYELGSSIVQLGLECMIVEVSDPVKPDKLHEAKFRSIDGNELHNNWSQLFTSKDTALLRNVYQREHVVTDDELEAIVGGKVPVVD